MPRFFTHVRYGSELVRDLEGEGFPSAVDARKSAQAGARVAIAREIEAGRDPVNLEFHVHDEEGAEVARFSVAATITGLEPLNGS